MVGNKQFMVVHQRLQEIMGNKEPFGGVHVIAVGDLFQLKPVMDQWIFLDLGSGYGPLTPNLWKQFFTVHELTQIMRQKDDKQFAELLNRLRKGIHTKADIDILQKRKVNQQEVINPSVPRLFPSNKLVNAYNELTFQSSGREKLLVSANDSICSDMTDTIKEGIKAAIPTDPSKTCGLFGALPIAVENKYETVVNVDVDDGITNGSSCVVKKLQYLDSNNPRPSIIWVQFDNLEAGREARCRYRQYYSPDIDVKWTPIFAIKRTFLVTKRKVMAVRQQFPLRPASAKTIHKAQGDTLAEVAVHMGSRVMPHAHYVALSRATTMNGLHILELSESKIKVEEAVNVEMRRMTTEAPMILCFSPLYSMQSSVLRLCFQNCRSYYKHYNHLKSDQIITSSDLICIAESRLKATDNNFEIPGYIFERNDQRQENVIRPPHGIAMFVSNKLKYFNVIKYTSKLFECMTLTIVDPFLQVSTVYKAPSCSFGQLKEFILQHLFKQIDVKKRFIIVGDFNCNIQHDSRIVQFMTSTFKCTQCVNEPTTSSNTTIDLVFSNIQIALCQAIYCAWSDHKSVQVSV
ncbi:uncharacterized protein [Apostichopus japonicus]|uniref:uncharacterized protein n=1 Tax=Stichopus japonicus TaxID=307972 RepID=UPI003AB39524